MATPLWKCILCPENELILKRTLACGQSFRWRETDSDVWTGVIGNRVWKLRQSQTHLYYQVFPEYSETLEQADISNVKIEKDEDGFPSIKLQNTMQETSMTLTECKQADRKFKIKVEIPDHKYEIDDKKVINKNKFRKSQHTDTAGDISDGTEKVDEEQSILRDYFQLNICLTKLYDHWSDVDPHFKEVSSKYSGIRMIRQDPVETLFSFICSSNNSIPRIIQLVDKLCSHYGEKIATVDGEDYYSFPKISAFVGDNVESNLRMLSFGYRAKYIHKSAKFILENHGKDWVNSLRQCDYQYAKQQLMKLLGVGPKIADCVCLMSLDKPGAIPVDTHVWKIAAEHYMLDLQGNKSLTDRLYKKIGKHFRDLWGEYAGWAHSVLFAADLKTITVPKDTSGSSAKATKREWPDELSKSKKFKQV
ncbi:N-glycosylase/DNA lyase-like [Gigantopelta aegis]|uniref:N-glycosylase/DNA lyase-like n=1 Tax=Gigantopelta aegis TaxID=1735272 RepID=UPI001B88D892|nr:N-glycosylase/DNA lyase-like [Gigantopelta aegis]